MQPYNAAVRDNVERPTAQQIGNGPENWGKQQGQPNIAVGNESVRLPGIHFNRPNDGLVNRFVRHGVVTSDVGNTMHFNDKIQAGDDEARSLPLEQTEKCSLHKRTLSADDISSESKNEMAIDRCSVPN